MFFTAMEKYMLLIHLWLLTGFHYVLHIYWVWVEEGRVVDHKHVFVMLPFFPNEKAKEAVTKRMNVVVTMNKLTNKRKPLVLNFLHSGIQVTSKSYV